jgi:glycerophosphoryl diester phosphodiesterase
MDYIEFDTQLSKDGTIVVPDKYRNELARKKLLHVKVTQQAIADDIPPRRPRREDEDIIEYYLENPIIIPGFKPPTREENYEGR